MGRISRALAAMQLALCSACFRNNYQSVRDEHPKLYGKGFSARYHHHSGGILRILDRANDVPPGAVQRWFKDADHGLFHGLCTAIAGALSAPDMLIGTGAMINQFHSAEPWSQRFFLSAVLHDFCRGGLNMEDGHDAALEKIFPDLLPETYVHAAPPERFFDSPLIRGDRLELQRFTGHDDWVKPESRIAPAKVDGPNGLYVFYKYVRPALAKLFFGSDEIWLRHGLENRDVRYKGPDHNWSLQTYPQASSYFNVRGGASESGFSVDLGRGGTEGCIGHGADWHHVQGIIPVRRFVACGGSVKLTDSTGERSEFSTFDHMCGVGEAPLSEWVFRYRVPDPEHAEYVNPYDACLKNMLANDALLLPTDIVTAWQYLVEQWKMRMEVMCEYDRGPT